jgi:anti-sigma factor RsiW
MSDDRHPDELLSAHVDGELGPEEAAWVEDHLRGCEPCREAEADLRAARTLLRQAPSGDASPVIEGFLARHQAIVRRGAGFVGVAAVVLALLALNAAVHRESVVPPVDDLVAAHLAGAPDDVLAVERRLDAPYGAPPGLIGTSVALSRQEVYDGPDVGAAVYRDGPLVVSVYQQPGRLAWGSLPSGGVEEVAGRPVWFRSGSPVVAVAEKGDLVVTVVSDDRGAVLTAVGGMPDWERRRILKRRREPVEIAGR